MTPFARPVASLDTLAGRCEERTVFRPGFSRRASQAAEHTCRGNAHKGMSIEASIAGKQGCVQRLEVWQFEQHAESLSRQERRYSRFSSVYSCPVDRSIRGADGEKTLINACHARPDPPLRCHPAAIGASEGFTPCGDATKQISGGPEGTRTPDLSFRKRLLYPAELRGRTGAFLAQEGPRASGGRLKMRPV